MELFLLHVLLFLVKCAHILLISLQHFVVSYMPNDRADS